LHTNAHKHNTHTHTNKHTHTHTLSCSQEFKAADRTSRELPALLVKAVASPSCVELRPSLLAAAVLAVLRGIKVGFAANS